MNIAIADRNDIRSIAAGGLVTSSFRNPWPKDAAVELSISRSDGSIEKHECLYLGSLPQVVSVRLLPGDVVECKRVGPSTFAL